MTLKQFLAAIDGPERSLAVINRTDPEPFQTMLTLLFERQNIAVTEEQREEFADNTVALIEEGDIVATSSFDAVQDAILMVNSDLYMTGTRTLEETDVPEVIDGLAETRFSLRGYPASNTEKLLLILISRHIERQALEHGTGTLRASFQRLSRLEDEFGTRRVYERVADTPVDVHLYGRPGLSPSPDFPVTVHAGHKADFRNSWFVIYRSERTPMAPRETDAISLPQTETDRDAETDTDRDAEATASVALLAIEIEEGRWDGYWTYNESLIAEIDQYVMRHL